ncbi:hypothetical protein ACQPXB_37495 [Amycolatopsis sp. CA-161197]|uniref:hypothetical protein n=1 Tax=Amycolatopsis sp. CA-161197 TaxID=3239922 RepID=UPI003D8D5ED2
MRTYDAQLTVGAPQPLPDDVALGRADEFLSTCCTSTSAGPREPCRHRFPRHRAAFLEPRAFSRLNLERDWLQFDLLVGWDPHE